MIFVSWLDPGSQATSKLFMRKMRRPTKANGPKGKSRLRWRMVSDQKQMATTKGAARGTAESEKG